MTGLEERKTLIDLISEATLAGARQAPACEMLALSARTVQRWRGGEPDAVDGRSLRHHQPSHKLSAEERTELLAVANSAEFGHLPPSQIVPRLADQQRYIASESTFYRVLKAEKQLAHRRSERPVKSCGKPRAVRADAPNQLYSWDITYLPATIRGQYFYLYLFMDVFSHALSRSVNFYFVQHLPLATTNIPRPPVDNGAAHSTRLWTAATRFRRCPPAPHELCLRPDAPLRVLSQ